MEKYGEATFLGLPLCLTPEDLRAGGVEVAVVGAPVDMGGRRALRRARRLRRELLRPPGLPRHADIEDEHVPGRNFVQVGLRPVLMPDDELLAWMRARGMWSHFMAEIDRIGFPAVLDKAIAQALDGPEYLHLSIDIDVLDPAYAPGTGTPEPPGLALRKKCLPGPAYLDPIAAGLDEPPEA